MMTQAQGPRGPAGVLGVVATAAALLIFPTEATQGSDAAYSPASVDHSVSGGRLI